MTVYWCDPYIDANVGGIHGTTETTTRTGTYAAPFSFYDVNNNYANNFPGVTLADEDEIRIKGLANVSAFLVDIGNDWYCNSYYRLNKDTTATAFTTEYTAKNNQAGYAFMIDPTVSERYMVANSASVIPPFIFTGGYGSSGTQITCYSSGGQAGFFQGVLQHLYPSSNRNMQVHLIDPDYYVSVENTTGTTHPFCKTDVDLKVTDGWTSETVRNGVCVLALEATNMGDTTRNFRFNSNVNNRGYGTWFDCLNTYYAAIDTNSSNCYARPYFYTNSAGGTYAGSAYTQKHGGFVKTDGGYPNYFYEANYHNGAGGSNDSDACNNLEVGITSCYYGAYVYAQYGNGIEYRINNLFARANGAGYYNTYNYSDYLQNGDANRRMDLKLGSLYSYSGTSGSFVNTTSNVKGGDAPNITFMDSACLYGYSGCDALFNYADAAMLEDVVFGSPIVTRTDYPGKFYSSGSPGPSVMAVAGKPEAYQPNVKMSPSSWTQGTAIFYDGRTSTPHDLIEANLPLGNLLTDDSDYRNTNTKVKVKTDMYVYPAYSAASTNTGDVNMHFSSNDYDGKPIGIMLSSQSNNSFHYGLIYYNDSAEENALVIQGNANAIDNYWYVKKLEIPIPKYTTENIRISINWKVDANWPNGNNIRFNVGHASATGWNWVSVYQSNNPASTNSSYVTTTVDIPNADMPTLQLNHMKIGIDVQNPNSHVHKVYIKTVGASLV